MKYTESKSDNKQSIGPNYYFIKQNKKQQKIIDWNKVSQSQNKPELLLSLKKPE